MIFFLHLVLLVLFLTQKLSFDTVFQISLSLIALGVFVGVLGFYAINRQQRYLRRTFRAIRARSAFNQAMTSTLQEIVSSYSQRSQLREYLNALHRDGHAPTDIQIELGALRRHPGLRLLDEIIRRANLERQSHSSSRGLSKESIENLMPVKKYQIDCDNENATEGEKNCCSICLEEFKIDQEVRVSPCSHIFHLGCIDAWLTIRNVCPNCKQEIGQVDSAGSSPAGISVHMQNVLRVETSFNQPLSIPTGDNSVILSSDDERDEMD